MTENPPISKDVKEFNFKLKCRLKLFDRLKVDRPTSLIATAHKYGVIFAGTPTGVQCIRTESILSLDVDHRLSKNVVSYPRRDMQFGVQPSHLSVNADCELLAVTLVPNDCAVLFVYSVASFGSAEIVKKNEVRLSSTPGVTVSDLHWNPGVANVLAVVMSDGTAAVMEFVDNSCNFLGSIPQNSQASSLCWSPKGKQVVIGAKNGSLTQYKPELKAVKTFPPPQLPGVGSLCVVSVHWLSNFQFIAAYRATSDPNARANVMVVNVPKNAPTTYVNYEDFCYSSNVSRPEHYFIHQPLWNILIVGTTNSMEANILGMDGDKWVQWMLDDGGRAELPLTEDRQDVYNVGMGFDISSTQRVPIGESLTVDPMPLLVMLSHDGVLCFFISINMIPGAPTICQPPQPFPVPSGLHLFNLPEAGDTSKQPAAPTEEPKPPEVKELGQQQPATAKPTGLSLPNSSAMNLGKTPIAQSNLSKEFSFATPNFNLDLGYGQPNQSLNFSQPISTSTAANQSWSTPVSKFSLGAQTNLGQQSAGQGLGLGGLGLNQPNNQQAMQQPMFGAAGSLSQPTWSSNQQPLISQQSTSGQPTVTLKQSSPIQASSMQPQPNLQQSSLSIPQSNVIQPPVSVPTTSQPLSFQPQTMSSCTSSEGNVPPPNQVSTAALSNLPVSNQPQPNQKSPPAPTQVSANSQRAVSTPVEQPSHHQPESSQLATISEVEEEPDEKEILKEMNLCQELLHNFSLEMEQKQAAIKYISAQTEFNISESKLKDQIIHDVEKLKKFEEELRETGAPDQADVNAIGNSVLELFAWYEKIKAKERMAKNPGYIELMESQDLDPITKNYLNSIDKYVYYLESQIKQARAKLGSLWDNIGSPHFEVPVMEVIYQSLIAQMNILAAKKAIVDSCETKMKKFNKNRTLRNPRRYAGDLELSTLAERLLDTRISDSDLLQDTSLRDASNNYIMLSKRMAKKNLNEDKVGALHEWHKNHKVITTKVSKKVAVVINSDFSKDETFATVISPSKQSTPYVHVTPKKATSSIPRKSLFTITNSIGNGHLENSELNAGLSNLDLEQSAGAVGKGAVLPTVVSERDEIKFESKNSPSPLDPILRNNLSTTVSKVLEGNKIEGVENNSAISGTSTAQVHTSTVSSLQPMTKEVSKESIPTPASFKGIQTQVSSKSKNEKIISTSWGAQTPVFGQSIFSLSGSSANAKGAVTTTSISIASSANEQVGKTSTAPTSFSFNISGNLANQPSSSPQAVFSPQTASSSANSVFFQSNQKTSVPSSSISAEKEVYEPAGTTAAPFYNPTPVKFTTTASNTFSFATATTAHAFNLPSSLSIVTITPANRTASSTVNSNAPSHPISTNQLSATATTTVLSTGSLATNPSPSIVSKSVSSIPPSAAVTSSNQQPLVSSQVFNVSQSATVASSVAERENQPKSGAPTWTGGSIFGGSSANISATSSSSTPASVFGGLLKTPVASSQSLFSGSIAFTSTSSPMNTPGVTSPNSVGSTGSISSTTTTAASVSTPPSTTSAFSVSSAPATLPSSSSSLTITAVSSISPSSTVTSTTTVSSAVTTSALATTPSVFGTPAAKTATPPTSTPSVTSCSPTSVSSSSLFSTTSVSSSAPVSSTPATTSLIFGGTPSTTAASVFSGIPKTTGSLFGTSTNTGLLFGKTSVFASTGTTATIFGSTNTVTTTSSTFGGTNTTTVSSIFGSVNSSATAQSGFGTTGTTATTTPQSALGNNATTSAQSVFGTTATTTPQSVFVNNVTTTAQSIFGSTPTTAAQPVFGSTATTTAQSVFGSTATTTAQSVFGSPATTAAQSVFGSTATTAAQSVFGSTATSTPQSVFGSTVTTTAQSIFGGTATTAAQSVFGNTATTTPQSVFGGTATTTPQSVSVFGAATTTASTPSIFGAASTTSSSIFGSVTTTTSSSVFGAVNTTTAASAFGSPNNQNSIFGAASALSSTSFFGSPTTTSTSSFGNQSAASIFGGSSSFGTPSTTNSFFGKPVCSPTTTTASPFGSSTNVFGTATTSASSIFGGNSFQQKSPFGQSSGNLFGQTTTSGGGNFGTSGGSLFGGSSSFGSPSSQGNIFQSGTTGSLFGGTANAGPFSGGSPAGNQPTFGSPPTFQSPQRPFGSPAPVFGGQSTFGAAPTFGGSPSFGSPGKVFGANTGGGQTFGSPTQQSSTFENLANQDTLSFGNLAQQPQPQAFPTNSFGGSSFSSWRS